MSSLDKILAIFDVDIVALLPEILKLIKLDEENTMQILEYPDNSGNVSCDADTRSQNANCYSYLPWVNNACLFSIVLIVSYMGKRLLTLLTRRRP